MTEEQDKPAENQPAAEPEGPRCGERLAAARREREISVLEVAKELHIDEPKVRALERNEFDALGAPVFAKGHLRKYAMLVGVDVDDVLTDYYQMTRQDSLPPVVVARRRSRQELSPGPWIAAIIVILVAAVSYWWFVVYSSQDTAPPRAPATTPEEPPAEQRSPADVAALPTTGQPPETLVTEDPAEPVVEEAPADEASAPPDGTSRLTLTFAGDCWTEVSDSTGRQLFFEMGRSGSVIELTGVAPFAVLFGNVDNVSVSLNGNDYPVSTTNPGGRTARLTISAP